MKLPRLLFILAFVAGVTPSWRLAAQVPTAATAPTVITSESSEVVSTDKETTFTFRDNVVVTGTNIRITCDLLVVVANRTGDPKATIGNQDKFKSLVATGHVHIFQSDREATCDRAEVFPGADRVVLTGSPRVWTTDGTYEATAPVMELFRGERRAHLKGPRIVLPPLKDLGYQKELAKPATPAEPANPRPQDAGKPAPSDK
jgi:lipopolysaccharide export system protein LptA